MNRDAKEALIVGLVKTIQTGILEKVAQMPEEWDGIELRQYVADTFAEQAGAMSFRSGVDRDRKRLADYRNEVLVRNL